MCSLLFNNCIYFIVLLLFNVNLCSCMHYPIQNTNNKNEISDWFQGLKSGLSFVIIYVFFYNSSKKKEVYFCINPFPFFGDNNRNLPYAIKWNKDYQKETSDPHLYKEWIPNNSARSSVFQSWKFAVYLFSSLVNKR